MYFRFGVFFIASLVSLNTHAVVVTDERGRIELDVPEKWKYEKNLFGLPHVFLSSTEPGKTSFSVTLTGIEGVNLPHKELAKNQKQYQDGRKKWAVERGFTITKFLPYEVKTNTQQVKIHVIGFEYKDKDSEYAEMSYYAECPKSLVHMKALGIKQSPSTIAAQKIPETIKCLN